MPDDIASGQSVDVRAGFWRRLLALSIDGIIISALFQMMVAVLFVATSGRIQIYGDVTHTKCAKLEKVPDGLAPPAAAGSNLARECNFYFFGAQTARILQVGRVAKDATATKTASRFFPPSFPSSLSAFEAAPRWNSSSSPFDIE